MKYYIYIILCVVSFNLLGQEIKNVKFNTTEEFVLVSYDLINCPSSWSYDVRVEAEVIEEGVKKVIVAKALDGENKKIRSGRNKTLRWRVFEDVEKLSGELVITVRIIDSHYFGSTTMNSRPKKQYSNELLGPEAALYSCILPGLGDLMVSDGDASQVTSVLFAGGYLLSGIFAFQAYSKSQEYYNLYLGASTQYLMDTNYELANDEYQQSKMWLKVAGAILVTDVTYVLIRGLINKGRSNNSYSLLNRTNLQFQYVKNGIGVGFKTKF